MAEMPSSYEQPTRSSPIQADIAPPAMSAPVVTSIAPPPVQPQEPTVLYLSKSLETAEISKVLDFGDDTLKQSRERKKAKKSVIANVVESVISTANAATKSESITIVYDKTGEVQTKTVVENHDSLMGNFTKLIALLTGTLGLYIGFKKFREPVKVV
jgi:hypothetical protein